MKEHAPGSLARAIRWSAVIVAAVVVGGIGLAGTALANFPHIKSATVTTVAPTAASASLTTGQAVTATLPDLLFSWTEVGLGSTNVIYQFSTNVTVTFGCVNNGSNHPNATNKTTVSEPKGASETLPVDKNGNVSSSFELSIGTVSSPADFSCPQGQTGEALSATFANNKLADTTNNVSVTLGDIVVNLGP